MSEYPTLTYGVHLIKESEMAWREVGNLHRSTHTMLRYCMCKQFMVIHAAVFWVTSPFSGVVGYQRYGEPW